MGRPTKRGRASSSDRKLGASQAARPARSGWEESGEGSSVVIDAEIDPSRIRGDVVGAVRRHRIVPDMRVGIYGPPLCGIETA